MTRVMNCSRLQDFYSPLDLQPIHSIELSADEVWKSLVSARTHYPLILDPAALPVSALQFPCLLHIK